MVSYIIGGLIGFIIALVGLLPPILHFVTGPLGPFLGGLAGGFTRQQKPGVAGIITIGVTLGFCLGAIFLITGTILLSPEFIATLESWTGFNLPKDIPTGTLLQVGIILLIYGAVLGSLGAALGAKFKNR